MCHYLFGAFKIHLHYAYKFNLEIFDDWRIFMTSILLIESIAQMHSIANNTELRKCIHKSLLLLPFGQRGVAGYCCMPRTKRDAQQKASGQGQIGNFFGLWSWVWHGLFGSVSVRLSFSRAFAYVSCDFWRLYDFSALYTKLASVFILFSAATCVTCPWQLLRSPDAAATASQPKLQQSKRVA